MSLARASTPALAGLAFLGVVLYAVSEHSLAPVHAEAYAKKLEAIRLMKRAEVVIRDAKTERGVAMDARNDPAGTGLIGPEFTLTTTDRGSQRSKSLAAQPNFAAVVTQMMLQAGVLPGDVVAVGMTGSLPGLNIAMLASCKAIGAEPIIVTSVGSSMFGATDPDLTWLDMESELAEHGLWPYRSAAASLGGDGDVGRGLSPAGRQLIVDSTRRNNIPLIESENLSEAVQQRVVLYDRIAAGRGRPIKLYVNIGGGAASLGGTQNGRLIPPGLTSRLAARSYPGRGVINVLAERGLPVIHLLGVEKLARDYGLIGDSGEPVPVGDGLLFVRFHYNLWIVGASVVALMIANLFVLRLDLRQKILGRPHPERTVQP